MKRTFLHFEPIVILLAGPLITLAPAFPAIATPYRLEDASDVEIGCQDPCACPVFMVGPVKGTFVLKQIENGGPFDVYSVSDVDWHASSTYLDLSFTGDGEYRVGGEVALQHQLALDLSVNGGPVQRFDSGLVGGGFQFPNIEIAVAANNFFCWDSVLAVSATPTTVGVDPSTLSPRALSALPNPFQSGTDISYALLVAGPVDLRIHDVAGRLVRTLSSGRWHAVGSYTSAWDGRTDDGNETPAGVYLVRFHSPQNHRGLRIVRLR